VEADPGGEAQAQVSDGVGVVELVQACVDLLWQPFRSKAASQAMRGLLNLGDGGAEDDHLFALVDEALGEHEREVFAVGLCGDEPPCGEGAVVSRDNGRARRLADALRQRDRPLDGEHELGL
jgi:hypothetical protein